MKQAMINGYKEIGYWMQFESGEDYAESRQRRAAIAARFTKKYGESIYVYVTGRVAV